MRIFLIALLLFSNLGFTQTIGELQQRLDKYNEALMPEHISLHLDRDSYFAGDRIWYAIYLNNTPRSASSVSAVVYIELRDARDAVITRQKIKCREGYGHADLLLSNKLRTGNYRLRAYTLWMKNNQDAEMFQITVPVINLDLPVVVSSREQQGEQDEAMLKVAVGPAGQFLVGSAGKGKIVAFDREEIIQIQDVMPGQEVQFSCGDRDHDVVSFALLSESGDVVEIREAECPRTTVRLAVDAGKREVRPRQKFEMAITLTDKFGNPLTGNVSVSVRTPEPQWRQLPEKADKPWLSAAGSSYGGSRKEMFVYPADQASLKPVVQQPSEPPVPFDIVIDSARARYIEEAGTNRNVIRAFGAQPYFEREAGYNIPFNISFLTRDYQSLPTIEDFIREVVSQARIRKSSGEKRIFIRYMAENSLLYHFKEPALVLLDGVAHSGGAEFLQTPLAEIDRIDLTWGMREINSMGVFSLADNGIVAIYSKSGSLRTSGTDLWKEYYHPLVFSSSSPESPGDEIPVLGEPVYWNPFVQVNGKTKITVQAPDRPGEIVIEVKGLTSSGHEVSARSSITVSLNGN